MARAKHKQRRFTHHAGGEHHSTNRQVGHTQRPAKFPLDPLGVLNGPMARIMDHNWSMFHRTLLAMQDESLRFFNRRLVHTSVIIEHSRDVHGVSGLMQLHQEWVADCARDYSEEATRFAQLVRELAADSAECLAGASQTLGRGEGGDEFEEAVGEGRRAAA